MNMVGILMEIPDIKETENQSNPVAYLKFFNSMGKGTWYVTEMGPIEDDVLLFGYVESPLGDDCNEWGYFTLSQLVSTKVIKLDKTFEPTPIKNIIGS